MARYPANNPVCIMANKDIKIIDDFLGMKYSIYTSIVDDSSKRAALLLLQMTVIFNVKTVVKPYEILDSLLSLLC
jgi:hypothetical protein